MYKPRFVIGLFLTIFPSGALAQTAGMVSFQGLIRDSVGNGIPSTPVTLTFNIYDAQTGGNVVAGPFTVNGVSPIGGIVATQFGPVAPSVFNGTDRYLEVTVGVFPTLSRVLMATPPATAEQLNRRGTGTPAVVALPNGNVGIGTTSPTNNLHISDAASGGIGVGVHIETTGAMGVTGTGIIFQRSGVAKKLIGFGDDQDDLLLFQGNGLNDSVANRRFIECQSTGNISMNGNVGIGTPAPSSKLHIEADDPNSTHLLVTNHVGDAAPSVFFRDDAHVGTTFHVKGDADLDAGGPYDFVIQRNGNVGIGTTAPGEKLYVGGDIRATGNVFASCGTLSCSDVRFKKRVSPIVGAVDKLGKFRGVTFDWRRKEFPDHRFSESRQIGLIAQDVQKVLPEVVARGSDGYLSVDYGRLTPVLIEAVRELKGENDALRAELEEQRRRECEVLDRLIVIEAAIAKTGVGR